MMGLRLLAAWLAFHRSELPSEAICQSNLQVLDVSFRVNLDLYLLVFRHQFFHVASQVDYQTIVQTRFTCFS